MDMRQSADAREMVPFVSIVIPCYNAEDWIESTIESALAQTWTNYEVVVVDDGSTDGSLEIVKSFGRRIRWETGPNRGGCAARNRGAEIAKGKWIQFLDSDDLLLPECLSSKVDFVIRNPEKISARVRPCSVVTVHDEADRLVCKPAWFFDRHDWKTILKSGAPQTAAPLLSKEDLITVGGFRNGLRSSQEFDLFLRMAFWHGYSFEAVEVEGVVIRVNNRSVSRGRDARVALTNFNSAQYVLSEKRKERELTEEERRAFACRFKINAKGLARVGYYSEFCKAWRLVALMTQSLESQGCLENLGLWIRMRLMFLLLYLYGLLARIVKATLEHFFKDKGARSVLNRLRRIKRLLFS